MSTTTSFPSTVADLVVGLQRTSRRARRPVPGVQVHAVPRGDRTRTALCGASVVVDGAAPFRADAPHACDDCARGGGSRHGAPLLAQAS